MYRKEKLAKEWLKAKQQAPSVEQINRWAGSDKDLATITLCILHPEELYILERNNNKEEITNYQVADAIAEYINYPKWFKIFVQINPFSLNILARNYAEQMDFIKPLLESYKQFQADEYLNELHFNGVITFPIKFKSNLNLSTLSPEDFKELVKEIVQKVPDSNFDFIEMSSKIFNFFLSGVPKETGNPLALKELPLFLDSLFTEYQDTLELANLPSVSLEDFMKTILRIDSIDIAGIFKNGEDHLAYEFSNPFDTTLTKQTINVQISKKAQEDSKKELLKFGWSTTKLATKAISTAIDPTAIAVGLLDPFETAEDIHEWLSQGVSLFSDDNHLINLFKEFSEQTAFDSFEGFVKNKINIELAKTAYTQFGIKSFDISPEFIDKVYTQFYFFNVAEQMAQKKLENKMIDVQKELKKQKMLKKTSEDSTINQLVSEYKPGNPLTNLRKKIIL